MATYSHTTNQGVPFPQMSTLLWEVPNVLEYMAKDIELRIVMRFANLAEFTSKVTTPVNGMLFWTEDTNELWLWVDGTPQRVWPTVPKISVGVGIPTGPGEAGEIYYELDA